MIMVSALCAAAMGCADYPALPTSEAPREAERAIANGDCRLLSVWDISENTPGASYEEALRRGVRPI